MYRGVARAGKKRGRPRKVEVQVQVSQQSAHQWPPNDAQADISQEQVHTLFSQRNVLEELSNRIMRECGAKVRDTIDFIPTMTGPRSKVGAQAKTDLKNQIQQIFGTRFLPCRAILAHFDDHALSEAAFVFGVALASVLSSENLFDLLLEFREIIGCSQFNALSEPHKAFDVYSNLLNDLHISSANAPSHSNPEVIRRSIQQAAFDGLDLLDEFSKRSRDGGLEVDTSREFLNNIKTTLQNLTTSVPPRNSAQFPFVITKLAGSSLSDWLTNALSALNDAHLMLNSQIPATQHAEQSPPSSDEDGDDEYSGQTFGAANLSVHDESLGQLAAAHQGPNPIPQDRTFPMSDTQFSDPEHQFSSNFSNDIGGAFSRQLDPQSLPNTTRSSVSRSATQTTPPSKQTRTRNQNANEGADTPENENEDGEEDGDEYIEEESAPESQRKTRNRVKPTRLQGSGDPNRFDSLESFIQRGSDGLIFLRDRAEDMAQQAPHEEHIIATAVAAVATTRRNASMPNLLDAPGGRRANKPFTDEMEQELFRMIKLVGPQWTLIVNYQDHFNRCLVGRKAVDLKDKARNMKKRAIQRGAYINFLESSRNWKYVSPHHTLDDTF